jgi:hypothetical protein
VLVADLSTAVDVAASYYYQLILLVGPPGSGKTRRLRRFAQERGCSPVTVGAQAAAALLEFSEHQRPQRIASVVADIVDARPEPVVLLDDIELLFDPSLETDPLQLLQRLSRNRMIVATWPGRYVGNVLTYADSGHPEHRAYRTPNVVVINAMSASAFPPAY